MTWDRRQFIGFITTSGLWPLDYAEHVLVRLAHNSAAIEGNTLTLGDSVTLLVEEMMPSRSPTRREIYEVENHREALARVITAVQEDESLTEVLVRDLHRALMDHLLSDRGSYKTTQNMIVGASWTPTEPAHVPEAVRQWADQTSWQLDNLKGRPLATALGDSHIAFERIHPFVDGNGRTGRALLAFQTIKAFGSPAIIPVREKAAYIDLLERGDGAGLGDMLATLCLEERETAKNFAAR